VLERVVWEPEASGVRRFQSGSGSRGWLTGIRGHVQGGVFEGRGPAVPGPCGSKRIGQCAQETAEGGGPWSAVHLLCSFERTSFSGF